MPRSLIIIFGLCAGVLAVIQLGQILFNALQADGPELVITSENLDEKNELSVSLKLQGTTPVTVQGITCRRARQFDGYALETNMMFLPPAEFTLAPSELEKIQFSLQEIPNEIQKLPSNFGDNGSVQDACHLNAIYRDQSGEFAFLNQKFFFNSLECDIGVIADNRFVGHSEELKRWFAGEESC